MIRSALVLALAACGSKSDPPAPTGDKPAVADTAFELEPIKIAGDQVIVEAAAPKGWNKTELTPNDHSYADPKGGMLPSTITISATCQGACDAESVNRVAPTMIDMQKAAGYTAKVTKTTALANGIELDLDVTKDGSDPFYQHVRYLYDATLPVAAQCMAMGVGKDGAAMRDRLKTACAKLTLKAK